MTELSFLLDILLNHKLQKATKELIMARIKEVEEGLTHKPQIYSPVPGAILPGTINGQVASTAALLAKHNLPMPPAQPVAEIAQTPATQAALAARQAIMEGNKPSMVSTGKGTLGPKKW